MTLDEVAEWQALAPTRAILGFYESALKECEEIKLSPSDSDPDTFWADSMKQELAKEVLQEFVTLLSNAEALTEELEAHYAE